MLVVSDTCMCDALDHMGKSCTMRMQLANMAGFLLIWHVNKCAGGTRGSCRKDGSRTHCRGGVGQARGAYQGRRLAHAHLPIDLVDPFVIKEGDVMFDLCFVYITSVIVHRIWRICLCHIRRVFETAWCSKGNWIRRVHVCGTRVS